MRVRFSPLADQFADPDPILADIRDLVASGDFTLGRVVREFEAVFAVNVGIKHAIGVNSGTDALKLGLKAVGIGPGDEVILPANAFWANLGAILEIGAKPVFVDCGEDFQIDVRQLANAISSKTRCLMPVHLTGDACDMDVILGLAIAAGLPVVEDACQCQGATWRGRNVGTFGAVAAFSLHPLKILNVWGDAGIVCTNDDHLAEKLILLRNHGLSDRDTMQIAGYNSRIDSLQAVVGAHVLKTHEWVVACRRMRASLYDVGLKDTPGLTIPPRHANSRGVFLFYPVLVGSDKRDALLSHLSAHGVEAKVHYPVPLYRQPAAQQLGYKAGQFPTADRLAACEVSLPCDQYLTVEQVEYVIGTVRGFFA